MECYVLSLLLYMCLYYCVIVIIIYVATAVKKFLWQLLYMIPDDLELQHRYICTLAKVEDDVHDNNNDSNSIRRNGSRRIIDPSTASSIRINLFSARGLPIRESVS